MEVKDCVFLQLSKAALAGRSFWGDKVAHLGVTAAQALVLSFLGEEDGVPSVVLSEKLRITSATMTGILDRLEKMDLVERIPNPEDRRGILVNLPAKGRDVSGKVREIIEIANREFLSAFSPEEELMFRGLLKRIGR